MTWVEWGANWKCSCECGTPRTWPGNCLIRLLAGQPSTYYFEVVALTRHLLYDFYGKALPHPVCDQTPCGLKQRKQGGEKTGSSSQARGHGFPAKHHMYTLAALAPALSRCHIFVCECTLNTVYMRSCALLLSLLMNEMMKTLVVNILKPAFTIDYFWFKITVLIILEFSMYFPWPMA